MNANPQHPINIVLSVLAPIVGANFVLRSARDSGIEVKKYPCIEYVIHKEGESKYDKATKSWRVELIIQLDYLLQEDLVQKFLESCELEESLAIQALQYSLTGKIRTLIQLLIDPGSLGQGFNEMDFVWAKYDFKLVRLVESAYFRLHEANEETGASSLFILSFLDVDNIICCLPKDLQGTYAMLKPDSVSGRLLKQKIDNL